MIKIIVTGGAGFIGSHKVYVTPEARPQRFDFSGFARNSRYVVIVVGIAVL